MYRTDKLDEEEEEVEGTLLGDGVEDVSILPFLYPRGTFSVSSLGYFSYVGSSS